MASLPKSRWPLDPLAEQDGVFFILNPATILTGVPEPSSQYLAYCQSAGSFRTHKLLVPTPFQESAALQSLISSKRWQQDLPNEGLFLSEITLKQQLSPPS
ncbi:MAG: hypothetical protein Q7Q71_14375 [Verrucomicrobiota bacterium JB023]|nr:hypothetical protein [Verrucomicrobiota bacterium JB023]